MRRVLALGFCFLIGVFPAHAQPSEPAAPPEFTPGPWEITAQMSLPIYVGIPGGGGATDVRTSGGFGARIGYRMSSSRRRLIEAYGLHAPQGSGAYSGAPQITAFGVGASYLARPADRRLNPYIAGGAGFWRVNAQTLSPCHPDEGCFREGSPSFEDATTLSAMVGVGTYVTLLPMVAVRAEASLYAPLAISGDKGPPRPMVSVGVSVRP